jgi:hypothetical protein
MVLTAVRSVETGFTEGGALSFRNVWVLTDGAPLVLVLFAENLHARYLMYGFKIGFGQSAVLWYLHGAGGF